MEYEGVRIDKEFLKDYSKQLEKEAACCEENVYAVAEVKFNLASPKQLGEVLFDKLKLDPKAKKTKSGQYATGEDVLMKLASQHKIVEDIIGFRELTKLKSTYIDALPTNDQSENRPGAYLLQPGSCGNRQVKQQQPQPAKHTGAYRTGPRNKKGIYSPR